ncbi:RNA polymerase sigma factor RpoE [soil metagenome]
MSQSLEANELSDSRIREGASPTDRHAAFVRLADGHLDAAYRLAGAIMRNHGEAEDATHDAILQAWRKWPTLRDQSLFEHWFDRILVNTCRNRLQRSARWQVRDVSDEITPATGDAFAQTLDRDLLAGAIAALPPDHRVVIALRYYRDLSVEQIAERLNIPSGTVRSRIHYALKKLHAAMDTAQSRGSDE